MHNDSNIVVSVDLYILSHVCSCSRSLADGSTQEHLCLGIVARGAAQQEDTADVLG